MKIAISGGTGFIGKSFSTFFIKKGIFTVTFSHEKKLLKLPILPQYVQLAPDLQTFPSLLLM